MSPETLRIDLPAREGDLAARWLSCRVAGPVDAPLLLFLHGFPEAAFAWDGIIERLSPRWRCVAPNLRGYPGSCCPDAVDAYRAPHLIADVHDLIQALTAASHPSRPPRVAALIGHDWGGAVAWAAAMRHPTVMQRLVILNAPHPAVFLHALQHDAAQQAASAYMNDLRREDAPARLAEDDYAGLWALFTQFGPAPWLDEDTKALYRQAWRQGLRGPLNYYRASPLHPPQPGDDDVMHVQLPPQAVQVQVPTHVIWGERDHALPATLLEGLERYVPQLRITRLPGASHWLVHEYPEDVARLIEATACGEALQSRL